ncbi:uncharacterized protein LOC144010535 isoform X2 [Festucalex cinctus]
MATDPFGDADREWPFGTRMSLRYNRAIGKLLFDGCWTKEKTQGHVDGSARPTTTTTTARCSRTGEVRASGSRSSRPKTKTTSEVGHVPRHLQQHWKTREASTTFKCRRPASCSWACQ